MWVVRLVEVLLVVGVTGATGVMLKALGVTGRAPTAHHQVPLVLEVSNAKPTKYHRYVLGPLCGLLSLS